MRGWLFVRNFKGFFYFGQFFLDVEKLTMFALVAEEGLGGLDDDVGLLVVEETAKGMDGVARGDVDLTVEMFEIGLLGLGKMLLKKGLI